MYIRIMSDNILKALVEKMCFVTAVVCCFDHTQFKQFSAMWNLENLESSGEF